MQVMRLASVLLIYYLKISYPSEINSESMNIYGLESMNIYIVFLSFVDLGSLFCFFASNFFLMLLQTEQNVQVSSQDGYSATFSFEVAMGLVFLLELCFEKVDVTSDDSATLPITINFFDFDLDMGLVALSKL